MTDREDWSIYPYDPVKSLPIIFAILIAVVGAFQFYQCLFRYRWFHFGAVMTLASCVWIAGFICRAISVWNQQSVGIYIAQFVLILVAPPMYGAAEYFILGRLLSYLPYHAPIHPGRVISTFLFLSAVIESLTATGAANSVARDNDPAVVRVGQDLLKAALTLQCFVEVGYFSVVAMVEVRCRRAGVFPRRVRIVVYALYITSSMLLVRGVFRAVEAFEASSCPMNTICGVLDTHEVFFWVFEVANITLFVILLALFCPGKYLPSDSKVFLDPVDGETERLGPGFAAADKRPAWKTFVDPFNLGAIVRGRGLQVGRFWDDPHPVHQTMDLSRSKSRNTNLE